ncbi:NAD-dependent epimerase/dehydratase family protein [Nocardia anaemiae]|uniref:NAD-dependent epimerase/dehydratase family protein n=1 Tax=Nocardia anaemiae TaxID=263910 RepID=UPI0007A46FA8|nr:NAD-dependent epimerase/dehydratase family protein [Nocardia anaemiae]
MRVVVLGATGNVGTSVIEALAEEPEVTSILGLARRVPERPHPAAQFIAVDMRGDDLAGWFAGADAVVHLAWLFQPTHRPMVTWRANVDGTARVFDAVAAARVPTLVYASSVGAYSPVTDDRAVSEDWPTEGWPPAAYMREKAYVERLLDLFEREHPECRVVRMRPAFTFRRESAAQQRRLFAGPLLPNRLVRPNLIPLLPIPRGMRFQAAHSHDIGRAYSRAIVSDVRGPFNLAADPVLDRTQLGRVFHARTVTMPPSVVRAALAVGWRLHTVPAPAELFDAMMRLPVLDTTRARTELQWTPRFSATEALEDMLAGLRTGAGGPTPPLAADAAGPLRLREFATGVGGSEPVDRWGP